MIGIKAPEYLTPLYTRSEAARIVGVPASTFDNWSKGYALRSADGSTPIMQEPIVTSSRASVKGSPSIPFVGLAEAYVLAALRKAGLPTLRIRSAVKRLREELNLSNALLSERLCTDGVELLYKNAENDLMVARSGQVVFEEVVRQYLRTIKYSNEYVSSFTPLSFGEDSPVVVDPKINYGQPTIVGTRVRVNDVVGRVKAGEHLSSVLEDYAIPDSKFDEVRKLVA